MYSIETIRAIQDMKKLAELIRKAKLDKECTELDKVKHWDMFLRGAFGQSFPIHREQRDCIVRDLRHMQDNAHINSSMRELMQSISLNL
jgi:hypothetical protein